ncbi:MAG: metalloregulator ArsR/SmtB family transcription factor [candidate division Zixibacteria bacterium]
MTEEVCEYLSVDEEKVARIRKRIGLENIGEKMAEIFKVLSDPTRLKIIQALELEELCVCDIASLIKLTQPSISHHLKALRQSGMVKYRKSGKMALYSIKDNRITALLAVARDTARR